MTHTIIVLFYLLVIVTTINSTNTRPIIGVLSQPLPSSLSSFLPPGHNYTSYISSCYVKWVESAGARVAPIIATEQEQTEYLRELFNGVSGVLLPGGGSSIHNSSYATASNLIYNWAVKENDEGTIFPIWGICLGFQMLALMAVGGQPNLIQCDSYNQALPLQLEDEWVDSRVLGQAPQDIVDYLTKLPVTINFHHWCLTRQNFTEMEMHNFWKLLSVNTDTQGLEFISTLEAKHYPFFASQFHPEKNSFEWAYGYPAIPHTKEAVHVGSYFTQFFMEIARQSTHRFPSRADEEKHLIYNYSPFYAGEEATKWNWGSTQVYLF